MKVNSVGYNFNNVQGFTGDTGKKIRNTAAAVVLGTAAACSLPSCTDLSADASATAIVIVNIDSNGNGTIIVGGDTIRVENCKLFIQKITTTQTYKPQPTNTWNEDNKIQSTLYERPIISNDSLITEYRRQPYWSNSAYVDTLKDYTADMAVYGSNGKVEYGGTTYVYNKIIKEFENGKLTTTLVGTPSLTYTTQIENISGDPHSADGPHVVDRINGNKWRVWNNANDPNDIENHPGGITKYFQLYENNGTYLGEFNFNNIQLKIAKRPDLMETETTEEWIELTGAELEAFLEAHPDIAKLFPCLFDTAYNELQNSIRDAQQAKQFARLNHSGEPPVSKWDREKYSQRDYNNRTAVQFKTLA